MQTLTSNFYGKTRTERRSNGRDYLVAPVTMIVEGVLAGSKGPLYYPLEELKKNPESWEGVPITHGHPQATDGMALSARDPEILDASGLGWVMKPQVKGDRLVGEGWFDIQETERVKPGLISAIKTGQRIELSTGLQTQDEKIKGQFKGKEYQAIARKYEPDHLAILTEEVGACSLQDGCGVNVNSRHIVLNRIAKVLGVNYADDGGQTGPAKIKGDGKRKGVVAASKIGKFRMKGKKGKPIKDIVNAGCSWKTMPNDVPVCFGKGGEVKAGPDIKKKRSAKGSKAKSPAKEKEPWQMGGHESSEAHQAYMERQSKLLREQHELQKGLKAQNAILRPLLNDLSPEAAIRLAPTIIERQGKRGKKKKNSKPSDKADVSPSKACKILKDDSAQGHLLTKRQKGMFGAICGKKKHNKSSLSHKHVTVLSKRVGRLTRMVKSRKGLKLEVNDHGYDAQLRPLSRIRVIGPQQFVDEFCKRTENMTANAWTDAARKKSAESRKSRGKKRKGKGNPFSSSQTRVGKSKKIDSGLFKQGDLVGDQLSEAVYKFRKTLGKTDLDWFSRGSDVKARKFTKKWLQDNPKAAKALEYYNRHQSKKRGKKLNTHEDCNCGGECKDCKMERITNAVGEILTTDPKVRNLMSKYSAKRRRKVLNHLFEQLEDAVMNRNDDELDDDDDVLNAEVDNEDIDNEDDEDEDMEDSEEDEDDSASDMKKKCNKLMKQNALLTKQNKLLINRLKKITDNEEDEDESDNALNEELTKRILSSIKGNKKGGDSDEVDETVSHIRNSRKANSNLTPEEQEVFNFGRQEIAKQKKALIGKLVANCSDSDLKRATKMLLNKSMDELRSLAALLPAQNQERVAPPIFTGQEGFSPALNMTDEDRSDCLELPVMNWAEEQENDRKAVKTA